MDERPDVRAPPDIKRPDPFGTVNLMGRDRQQVDAELVNVDLDLAERLDRVGMDKDTLVMGDPDDVLDGLNGPDLVVGVHDRNEGRPGS